MLNLLELIAKEESCFFSLRILAKELKSDLRVVTRTINDLNSLKPAMEGIQLKLVKDKLTVIIGPNFSFTRIKQDLLKESLVFILCKDLLENRFISILEFSLDHYVSNSTMYRKINKLKECLKEYQLVLDLSAKDYFIGEETQVRHFFYELYFSAYGFAKIESNLSEELTVELNKHVRKELVNVPYPLLKKTEILSIVSILRWQAGYFIEIELSKVQYYEVQLPISRLISYFNQLQIQIEVKSDDLTKMNEQNFFLAYLLTIDILGMDKFNLVNFEEMPESSELPSQWIKEYCLFFNVEVSTATYFFALVNLSYYFYRMDLLSQSSQYNFIPQTLFEEQVKEDMYVFERTVTFTNYLSEVKGFPAMPSTDYFYYMLIREILSVSKKKIVVCVFSSLSHSQKQRIEKQISAYSPVPVSFSETNVDLVVSDFHFETKRTAVFIDVFPRGYDYQIIKKHILKLYEQMTEETMKRSN